MGFTGGAWRHFHEEPWGGLPVDGRASIVHGATTSQQARDAAEIGSRIVLPDPSSIRPFDPCSSVKGAREISRALDALERLGEGTPTREFAWICDSIHAEFGAQTSDAAAVPQGGGWPPFYDFYFSVERLSASASPEAVIRSWVGALAIVMKHTAMTERGATHLSPLEFGLLRQSFATIIELIRELIETAHGAPVG